MQGNAALRSVRCDITVSSPAAKANGGSIVITASTTNGCLLGSSALAEPRKSHEQVGQAAAEEMLGALSTGACVDQWLQDQLIIYMAMAEGESAISCGELTLHTRTAIAVAEQLTAAKFQIVQQSKHIWLISCNGAAIRAG